MNNILFPPKKLFETVDSEQSIPKSRRCTAFVKINAQAVDFYHSLFFWNNGKISILLELKSIKMSPRLQFHE